MSHSPQDRPLSPHLQVYRLPLTALTSISHRLTGIALFLGSLLLVGWLWAVAYDGAYFDFWSDIATHWAAKVVLIGWSFALFYHMANGVRHLFWDAGKGFDVACATKSGVVVIMVAIGMTFAVWCALFQQISFDF
jgi:succinate dehydrogenase / fumarate reductase cytochrome b subunit